MRTGKIARLPHPTREQLNRRLEASENYEPILNWLNALPEYRPKEGTRVLGLDRTPQYPRKALPRSRSRSFSRNPRENRKRTQTHVGRRSIVQSSEFKVQCFPGLILSSPVKPGKAW